MHQILMIYTKLQVLVSSSNFIKFNILFRMLGDFNIVFYFISYETIRLLQNSKTFYSKSKLDSVDTFYFLGESVLTTPIHNCLTYAGNNTINTKNSMIAHTCMCMYLYKVHVPEPLGERSASHSHSRTVANWDLTTFWHTVIWNIWLLQKKASVQTS